MVPKRVSCRNLYIYALNNCCLNKTLLRQFFLSDLLTHSHLKKIVNILYSLVNICAEIQDQKPYDLLRKNSRNIRNPKAEYSHNLL